MQKGSLDPLKITKYWQNQYPPNLNQLRATGQKFTDPYFPPHVYSLESKDRNGKFVDTLKGAEQLRYLEEDIPQANKGRLIWKRVTELKPNWELFEGKVEFSDVNQGLLGDCYFLSSITALAEYPYIIREKFRTKKFNNEGYYEMIFFIDGEWQIVFVDDYFPIDTRTKLFAFASPNGNELWAILLEKAWAKLNGGYSNTIGGIVSEPITSLTGFPTEYLEHDEFEIDEVYKKIEKCNNEGTIMSSASKQDSKIAKKGLVLAHAYTLIGAKKWEERNIYLIKLRNPWGEKEWTGKWSDKSSYWTEEYKRYFGYENKNDGVFWIDRDDYIDNFDATYICHIFYGSVVRNFYFEYESYFKKPAVFNLLIREQSKTSISVIFNNWRFNRKNHNVVHPFSLLVGKYNRNRKIEKLYGKWSSKDDVNLIEDLAPGYYIIWLYCPFEHIKNEPNYKFVVQISSMKTFDVEYIGLDQNFMLVQYLLLENYTVTGAHALNSSKEYFIGNDKEFNKVGLNNLLLYNKTNKTIEIMVSTKCVINCAILPPYTGLKNIKMTIPPFERACLVGLRLSNSSVSFSYTFQLSIPSGGTGQWNQIDFGSRFANFMKFDISNNSNAEMMGIRTGEYQYVGKSKAKELPVFDNSKFVGKDILQKSMMHNEVITPQTLSREYPIIQNLLQKFPQDISPNKPKKWDKISNEDGIYIGEINSNTGELEGRGVFLWKDGKKYVGSWKNGNMCGNGMICDAYNNILFEGTYFNNKKYGKGKLFMNGGEYYEGEFFDDRMEGRGSYHFASGQVWEGTFRNNMKNGVGIMTLSNNKDNVILAEFENDHYIGGTTLNKEEAAKALMMRDNERKEMIVQERKKQAEREKELMIEEQKKKEIEQIKDEASKLQALILEKMRQDQLKRQEEFELKKKYEEEEKRRKQQQQISIFGGLFQQQNLGGYENMYIQKNLINPGITIQQMNYEVQEKPEEKRHRLYLENVEKFKEKEPYMMEKFLQLKPLNYDEEMHYINQGPNNIYVGGCMIKTFGNTQEFVKQGRGVFFDGNSYLAGYWENNAPNGFFYKYNDKKQLKFKGFLLPNLTINPSYPGYLYFKNGDSYHGYFANNKMNGFGTYYYARGDSWTGQFTDGKFNGQGKYFYENGLISEDITYNNNKVVSRQNLKKDDLKDPNFVNFFNQIQQTYPGVKERLLLLPPLRETKDNLKWTTITYQNGTIYIGQVNSNGQAHGRCCFIYKNSPITYYVGYIKNQEVYDEGTYYDSNWNMKYDGKFEHNKKNGFGVSIQPDGATYAGFFADDNLNGLGVLYYPDGSRFEGSFINGKKNDKGYLISPDLTKKQEVVYKDDNVIEQGDIINFKNLTYKRQLQKEFEEFAEKCRIRGYEKYLELMMDLQPTNESYTLKFGIKEEISEVYIGEMNSIGFKYGRGVLINNNSSSFYVGYFVNNEKHGKGIIYYDYLNPKYIGEFQRDKPMHKGEYIYKNGEVLQGTFNSIGEGKGVYTFSDGDYWRGTFFAWALNGSGEYYTKDGRMIGNKRYENNKCIG